MNVLSCWDLHRKYDITLMSVHFKGTLHPKIRKESFYFTHSSIYLTRLIEWSSGDVMEMSACAPI